VPRSQLNIRIPDYLLAKCKRAAAAEDMDFSEWVRSALLSASLEVTADDTIVVTCPHCGHTDVLADNGWLAWTCLECHGEIQREEVA